MKLPGPLAALDLGEPPLGHLRTAGQVPFVSDTGEEKLASIWFVVCRTRCWLVAATLEDQWSVGDTDVALDRGWTWDAIRVGAWSTPLRNGTRGQADGLLKQWRLCEKGGTAVPAPYPDLPITRAPAAAGAHNVPDWLPPTVSAAPEARWLFAFETGREVPHLARNGQLERTNVWLAVSDAAVVLVAQGPVDPLLRTIEPPIELRRRTTARDLVVAGGWELPGALVDRMSPLAVDLANASPGAARWSVAVRQALDLGEPERAIGLLREAFVHDRHTASWGWVGLLALERASTASTGAVLQLLAEQPDLDLRELALGWAHRRSDLRSVATDLPAGLLAECTVPPVPEGLPWPPEGPFEVVGTAALLAGRTADGLALMAERGDTPRVHQAMAAMAAAAGEAEAWAGWWDTAKRWRPVDPVRSLEAIDRAIRLAPDPAPLHYRAAAWRHLDGQDATPHWTAALPAAPPDDLEQSTDAWRALATFAEGAGVPEVAVLAHRRVRTLDATDRVALQAEARLLERELDRPDEAVDALRLLAERTDAVVEPEPTRWFVWTEIGRLLAVLDEREGRTEHPEVRASLREAVRGDFLVPEAVDRALEIGDGRVPDAQLGWWRHLRSALTGGSEGTARVPARSLAGDALDALHPGGLGWLERARQNLDTSEPPPIKELTRGLEKVVPARWPRVSAAISSLAEALSIDPPDTYLFRGEGAWGLSAWPTAPPLVLVGADHLDTDDAHPLGMRREALAFALAVEMVHLAAGHPLLAFDGGLVGTSRSVYQAFGKYAGAAETVVDVVTLLPGVDQLAKIQTVIKLSKRVFTARAMVDKTTGFAETGMSWLGWTGEQETQVGRRFQGAAIQFRVQADRAALLLTGDLHAAVEAILRGQPTTAGKLTKVREQGLVAVLPELDQDTGMRIAALLEFAATL
ncbi:MAG: hypothetical protein R3F61_08530 [Myxococcota bacterium]